MSDRQSIVRHEEHQTTIRARLIVNPEAWQAGAGVVTIDHLSTTLRTHGIDAQVALISPERSGAQLAHAAVDEGFTLVIAAGGDGTIHEIAKCLLNTHVALAIVPMGTINNLAFSLFIPEDLDEACAVIAAGHRRKIDVGMVNGKPFFEVVSVGAEASFFPLAESLRHKGVMGATRAAIEGVRTLTRTQMHPVTLEIDGKRRRIHAWQITVCNPPVYGLRFAAAPEARMDDGLLDIVISRQQKRWQWVQHYQSLMSGKRTPDTQTETVRAHRIRISGHYRMPVAVDGDAFGETPISVTVASHALTVIAPNMPSTPSIPIDNSPLRLLARSIAPQGPETNAHVHMPEETVARLEAVTRYYWLALPLVAIVTLLARLAHWPPVLDGHDESPPRYQIVQERPGASRLMAAMLAAIFGRLQLTLEVFTFMLTGGISPLCRALRVVARRNPRMVAPDEGTMHAVAGTGILAAGMWASRKASWRRNIFLVWLLGAGLWFARVGRHTKETPARQRDAITLGAGLGALWLGGSLTFLSWGQRRLLHAAKPKAGTKSSGTKSLGNLKSVMAPTVESPPLVPQDIAPVAIMTKLERGDLLLFGPDHSFGANLIEFLTRSHYHHVAIYDGEGMVIEAMPEGVGRFALRDRNVTGIRPNVLPEQRTVAADWARSHAGGLYDRHGLALIAFDRIFPGLRLGSPAANRFSCAVFIADAYLHAGVDLFPGERWQDLVPSDFIALLDQAPHA